MNAHLGLMLSFCGWWWWCAKSFSCPTQLLCWGCVVVGLWQKQKPHFICYSPDFDFNGRFWGIKQQKTTTSSSSSPPPTTKTTTRTNLGYKWPDLQLDFWINKNNINNNNNNKTKTRKTATTMYHYLLTQIWQKFKVRLIARTTTRPTTKQQ